jgi:Nucleotidyl transferase AbiEii toxin, Type IV TA system
MKGFPNTYSPAEPDDSVQRNPVFEPALKHYPRAFRAGEPAFDSPVLATQWHDARRRAMEHLLGLVVRSLWRDALVLRGSMVLKAWLGAAAREPGDMDWVVTPPTAKVSDAWVTEMFSDFVQKVSESSHAEGIDFLAGGIAIDDIWTYERAPGRRMVFPWQAEGLPPGTVQMDFVFNEELWCPPIQTPIPTRDGASAIVWTASKELSLAWKILWLVTDSYPQGKDLYDATLLAEQTTLPPELLKTVLTRATHPYSRAWTTDFPMHLQVDWDNFKLEYPQVPGNLEDWLLRFTNALGPTIAECDMIVRDDLEA